MLLATKLHVPRPRPGFVPRPRLAGALDEGLARRLILVCAPAGSGKTALLAGWARSGNRPVAWLSLDAADNDPVRLWRHVVAALDRARPGIAERVGLLLGPPAPPSFEGLVTALINELAAWPGEDEVVLVLDDYHLIDAQPVHVSLGFLLEHLPPGLHLVLASRADPPLPLARLRAGGQLAELRAADLLFTAEEAAALLRESAGADLPATAVAALTARTEGWVAGLQLAALSLRGQADPAGFVAAFSGSHRYVLDYLAEEVLDRQHEELRTFLLETSLLERLSGGLCDAVTGRTDSQAMLERVEQAGLFLVPLDEVRGWWRYHHLFADLLRARLQQQRPGRVPALHRAAAACVRIMASPTTRCATPWPPGTPPGRHGWSNGTPTRFSCAAKARPCSGGLRRCPPGWPARGRGCCWPRRAWLSSATAWRRPRSRWMPPSARWPALRAWPMSRSSLLSAGPRATWPTCPRRSRSGAPCWPCSMAMPNARSHSAAGPLPRLARASGCWHPTPTGIWAWPSGCAAGLLNPVPAQRARLLLSQGEVAAAARWAQQRGLGPDDEPGYPREPGYLVLARVLLAQDRPGAALALLERLHAAAVSHLLGKLGAANRTEAVTRARQLGLIP